jgi:hypothetical protein
VREPSSIVDLHLGVKINPAAGCAGRGDREEKREDLLAKSTDRTVCFHINIL